MASPSTILRSSPCQWRSDLFTAPLSRLHSPLSLHAAFPRLPFRGAVISFARRRSGQDRPISSPPGNKRKKKQSRKDHGTDDGLDEDAFEALFQQLEKDLKNDQSVDDSDDDFTEEDLAKLEKELEGVLAEDEDLSDVLNTTVFEAEGGGVERVEENEEYGEEDIDEEENEPPVKLKGWQLRRMAYALKKGRRKVSIKDLAAEVCLDRAVVLELLREPPPDLLLMSAALPDRPEQDITVPDIELEDSQNAEPVLSVPSEATPDSAKSETDLKSPIHVLQRGWAAQKRIKKAHLETLERVYRRSTRPTNAIISSIVLVTNLPRKKIVKWFEDKRAADGIPEQRRPYQRSASEPAFVRFSNIRAEADPS